MEGAGGVPGDGRAAPPVRGEARLADLRERLAVPVLARLEAVMAADDLAGAGVLAAEDLERGEQRGEAVLLGGGLLGGEGQRLGVSEVDGFAAAGVDAGAALGVRGLLVGRGGERVAAGFLEAQRLQDRGAGVGGGRTLRAGGWLDAGRLRGALRSLDPGDAGGRVLHVEAGGAGDGAGACLLAFDGAGRGEQLVAQGDLDVLEAGDPRVGEGHAAVSEGVAGGGRTGGVDLRPGPGRGWRGGREGDHGGGQLLGEREAGREGRVDGPARGGVEEGAVDGREGGERRAGARG